ncbi:Protein Z-Dependent Protease Inhibitor [Manis pentadactyla]|nr:Protein Z-Dependent Protease Inhibitor [Manis pentadactyla]
MGSAGQTQKVKSAASPTLLRPAQGHHLPASTPCPPGSGPHLDDGLPSVLLPGLAHTLMDGAQCAVP